MAYAHGSAVPRAVPADPMVTEHVERAVIHAAVGGRRAVYDQIEPLLQLIGEEITYCGAAGMGQLVKIMNNMVLFQTVSP